MKLLLLVLLLTSCYNMPTFEEWAEKSVKPKMKRYTHMLLCKEASYRAHCSDGEVFASEECVDQYTKCLKDLETEGVENGNE